MWVGDFVGHGVQDVLPGQRVTAVFFTHKGAGERAGEPDEVVWGSAGADHAAVVVGHTLALCVVPALRLAAVAGVADGQGAAGAAVRPAGQDDCKKSRWAVGAVKSRYRQRLID